MGIVVETSAGRLEGVQEEGLQSFRGIPFAKPPVGTLRFAAPEAPEPWSGVRSARDFGPSAPQTEVPLAASFGLQVGEQSEDCLTLNVFTPAADGARRPVMVWIHGGAFTIGAGSQPTTGWAPSAFSTWRSTLVRSSARPRTRASSTRSQRSRGSGTTSKCSGAIRRA
jgi:carboxylesterase type B